MCCLYYTHSLEGGEVERRRGGRGVGDGVEGDEGEGGGSCLGWLFIYFCLQSQAGETEGNTSITIHGT